MSSAPSLITGPKADDIMQYDITFPGDITGSDAIQSPGREREDGSLSQSPRESSSPTASGPQPTKPAAKRKRENRYKNAPPSVVSVRLAADHSVGHLADATRRTGNPSQTPPPTPLTAAGMGPTHALQREPPEREREGESLS